MTANRDMIDYWNDNAGQTWVDEQERMDAMLSPLTDQLLEAAAGTADERAIDVGCGCGDTTIRLAQSGTAVWGVDISEPMLARAKERAESEGIKNVAFSKMDASAVDYTPDHQLIISRFGVMFFDDPTAAFARMRTGLAPGGRIAMLVWQKPRNNPWMSTVGAAVRHLMPTPDSPPDLRAPGPFAFADQDYVNGMLTDAGYDDISIDPIEGSLHMGTDLDDIVEAQTKIGPLAGALAALDADGRSQALDIARETLGGLMTEDGLSLGAACWLLRATSAE